MGGEMEGGKKGKGEFKVQWEWQENWEEHIFKPMLIYCSSQAKQIKTGKKIYSS
jgi:hypothetical protein